MHVPPTTEDRWVVEAGKKIDLRHAYEPWIAEHFSGYLCIDEVYDGPYCIFYAVDPELRKRVAFQVSDAGTEAERRRFLQYLADIQPYRKGLGLAG